MSLNGPLLIKFDIPAGNEFPCPEASVGWRTSFRPIQESSWAEVIDECASRFGLDRDRKHELSFYLSGKIVFEIPVVRRVLLRTRLSLAVNKETV